jgi:hypothetical protein
MHLPSAGRRSGFGRAVVQLLFAAQQLAQVERAGSAALACLRVRHHRGHLRVQDVHQHLDTLGSARRGASELKGMRDGGGVEGQRAHLGEAAPLSCPGLPLRSNRRRAYPTQRTLLFDTGVCRQLTCLSSRHPIWCSSLGVVPVRRVRLNTLIRCPDSPLHTPSSPMKRSQIPTVAEEG